ncbi:MAG: formimidoylglutamate deiminase [Cypionkella sp.]|nr:formimidoylglutamate deiminase [Cypionkella sp.]
MPILHAKSALTPQGWQSDVQITIGADGQIAAVGPQRDAPDHRCPIVLPAPVNLHSHAFQRAMAGLTEARGGDASDSFWTWRRLMYRFLDQLSPTDIQAIAAQVYMEMLEAGFAAVAEFHYLHHDVGGVPYRDLAEMSHRIIAAAGQAGIGLTLLPVLYQYGGCDGRALNGGQARFGNDPDQFLRLHRAAGRAMAAAPADYVLGMAPHSLRAVSPDGLGAILAHAETGPIHMHLAEQVAEVDEVQAHLGARPTEWLLASHKVGPQWCLIHCTQMNGHETQGLAQTGAVVGLCPLTEASLGDGIFNGRDYAQAGGRFGFGSDSNIQISLFEELKARENSQRLALRARAVMAAPPRSTGRVLMDAAVKGGAQAGGRRSGAIAASYLADLIGLDDDNAYLCNRQGDQILDTLIFGGGAGAIRDVFSAGRHMVQGGRHIHRDAIVANYMRVMRALSTAL